jgi:hypothetical protein
MGYSYMGLQGNIPIPAIPCNTFVEMVEAPGAITDFEKKFRC